MREKGYFIFPDKRHFIEFMIAEAVATPAVMLLLTPYMLFVLELTWEKYWVWIWTGIPAGLGINFFIYKWVGFWIRRLNDIFHFKDV